MDRRTFLELTPVSCLAGCLTPARENGAISGEPDVGGSESTEPQSQRPETGTIEDFEGLAAWESMDGTLEAERSYRASGTQSARLKASTDENRVRIRRRYDPPLDVSGRGLRLTVRADRDIYPWIQVFDADGDRIDFQAPVRGGLAFQPFDFGIDAVDGEPSLSQVTEVRITVWVGERDATLWCDDLRLTERPDTGTVLLQFDDGNETDYTRALPILDEHGFVASTFVNPATVGSEGNLTLDQLSELHDAGWDVCNHTVDHATLPDLPDEEKRSQIVESKEWLIDHGFARGADYFAYPNSAYDQTTLDVASRHHRLCFAGGTPGYGSVGNPAVVQRIGDPDAATAREVIDVAAAYRGVAALFFHTLTDDPGRFETAVSDFEETIAYLDDRASNGDVRVLPVREFGREAVT